MSVSVLNTTAGLSGKTLALLEGSQTFTGQKTFDVGASAPFVVVAGAAKVTNLDADKLDGLDSLAYAILANAAAFASTLTVADNIGMVAAKKLYLDGIAMSGDTYIHESAANVLSLFSGGVEAKLTSGVLTVGGFGTNVFTAGGTGANILGVRNTTAGTGNLSELRVGNDAAADRFFIDTFSSTFTPAGSSLADGSTIGNTGAGGLSLQSTHASGQIRFYAGGTTRRILLDTTGIVTMDVYGAGTATFSAAGVISSVSDERLKDILGPLSYGLAEVLQLNPIRYHWTDASGLNDAAHTEYGGFGAMNVEAVMPLAIGHDIHGFRSLSDRPILGALVNAVKELNGGWQQHDADITALRAELEALRSDTHG